MALRQRLHAKCALHQISRQVPTPLPSKTSSCWCLEDSRGVFYHMSSKWFLFYTLWISWNAGQPPLGGALDHWWENPPNLWMAWILSTSLWKTLVGGDLDTTTPCPYGTVEWWCSWNHCISLWSYYDPNSPVFVWKSILLFPFRRGHGLNMAINLFSLLLYMNNYRFPVTILVGLVTGSPTAPSSAAGTSLLHINHHLPLQSSKWR